MCYCKQLVVISDQEIHFSERNRVHVPFISESQYFGSRGKCVNTHVTNLKLSNCIFINFVEVGNFYSLTLGLFWQNASFAHFGHFQPGIGTNGLIGPTLAQLEEMMSGIITSI